MNGLRKSYTPYTYFVQAIDGGPVKIGRSSEPTRRLPSIQCGNPSELRFLAIVKGDYEASIHRELAHCRLNGEWFAWTDETSSVIRWARSKDCARRLQVAT